MIHQNPTPVDTIEFNGHVIHVKRDDLQHPHFSGNKARKLHYLLTTDQSHISTLVGYGSAQANSLLSLAALAKAKSWGLEYYVDHIPGYLKQHPRGNYRQALELGAEIISIGDQRGDLGMQGFIEQQILPERDDVLFVPEGGRSPLAETGIKRLADEIRVWASEQQVDELKIMLPSGTGTTALYLQKHLPFEVLTCACVGDSHYLTEQFNQLSDDSHHHPKILTGDKKYHFGKPYREFYQIWHQLHQHTGIEFELLYDPLGWLLLLDYLNEQQQKAGPAILYIHQGGLLGNASMLPRYRRKGLT